MEGSALITVEFKQGRRRLAHAAESRRDALLRAPGHQTAAFAKFFPVPSRCPSSPLQNLLNLHVYAVVAFFADSSSVEGECNQPRITPLCSTAPRARESAHSNCHFISKRRYVPSSKRHTSISAERCDENFMTLTYVRIRPLYTYPSYVKL